MGKLVRAFRFALHESQSTKENASTVTQSFEQPLYHPNRRLSLFVGCVCHGNIRGKVSSLQQQ